MENKTNKQLGKEIEFGIFGNNPYSENAEFRKVISVLTKKLDKTLLTEDELLIINTFESNTIAIKELKLNL